MTGPPDAAAAPEGATVQPQPTTLDQKDQSQHNRPVGQDAVTAAAERWPDIPIEMLISPTLGAWRRARGLDGWSDFGKVYFARIVIEEAQRRVLLDRLGGIYRFLEVGATPDQAMARVDRLVDDYHGAFGELETRAAA